MPPESSESPTENFFNDLSQQPYQDQNGNGRAQIERADSNDTKDGDGSNKPKRIACVLCRKRKLRCDGTRPTCGTCKRLAHECAYDEVRKKSGPKRGYVKLLEARLHQVETLLKSQEKSDQQKDATSVNSSFANNITPQGMPDGFMGGSDQMPATFPESLSPSDPFPAMPTNGSTNANSGDEEFPWEMIGLGLDEPLPPQDVINDLHQIYFTKIHPSLPIIHRPRYLAAMNLAPHMRPPVCLRYIMWCLAASVTDKYDALQEHFYHRARKYAQMDEMKGHGESTITLAHCQTWILMGTYEFKQMYFPRAWLSAGRAVRLAQMMQLHRMDGVGLDVKQCLPPPKDWTEREERRRTFWMAFCIDRYASIGTGWPMTIDERDIMTNMPANEEAFEKSKPMPTGSLDQAMAPQGAGSLTPLGGIVLTAALFGRNLLHLHRPTAEDHDEDLNGAFWTRHRGLENILLNTSLGLPDHLRLPAGLPDPNVIFTNMSIHTSAICLHQAAIFKADKYHLPVNISNESKIRCVTAAAEIATVMRMISHMDLASMNPFISFCVYVAARVFVQYLKTRPKDQQMNSSLQFLLQAMQALRRKNPLTESFLVQLDLDLESAGVLGLQQKPYFNPSPKGPAEIPVNTDAMKCSPLFDIRESQSATAAINTFGNPGLTAHSAPQQPVGNSPGPPFHVANTNLRMDVEPAVYPFVPSQNSPRMDLPQRHKSSHGHIQRYDQVQTDSEMDTSPDTSADQPTPSSANSQSRQGSSSNTTFTPPQQPDDSRLSRNRPSPKLPINVSETNNLNLLAAGRTSSASNNDFFSTSNDIFPSLSTNNYYPDPVNPSHNDPGTGGFIMGNEWDLPPGTGTGMTPMSDGGWPSMLDSINMGWDSLGPSHANEDMAGRRIG